MENTRNVYPPSVQALIDAFKMYPSVGDKTGKRFAMFTLKMNDDKFSRLMRALDESRQKVGTCGRCYNLADADLCVVCANPRRNHKTICVVADFEETAAIEKSGEYQGLYHVLGGVLSPMEGIGRDDLTIDLLLDRIHAFGPIDEVILALPTSMEGQTTLLYLAEELAPIVPKITTLARGVPFNASLDYADEATVGFALGGRIGVPTRRQFSGHPIVRMPEEGTSPDELPEEEISDRVVVQDLLPTVETEISGEDEDLDF